MAPIVAGLEGPAIYKIWEGMMATTKKQDIGLTLFGAALAVLGACVIIFSNDLADLTPRGLPLWLVGSGLIIGGLILSGAGIRRQVVRQRSWSAVPEESPPPAETIDHERDAAENDYCTRKTFRQGQPSVFGELEPSTPVEDEQQEPGYRHRAAKDHLIPRQLDPLGVETGWYFRLFVSVRHACSPRW
jgi:hypothetical protein